MKKYFALVRKTTRMKNRPKTITTWSENITYQENNNLRIEKPTTIDKLRKIILESEHVSVVGSNWNWIKVVDDQLKTTLIDTSALTKTINGKRIEICENDCAWVSAGLNVYKMAKLLRKKNLSIPILGLVHGQTIGGVCNSGTHGGSLHFGCIASYVLKYRVLNYKGELVEIDIQENPGYGVSLGVLGVIVGVKLQCKKSEILTGKIEFLKFEEYIKKFDSLSKENRYVDVTWFPQSGICRIMRTNEAKNTDQFTKKRFHSKFIQNNSDTLECLVRFYSNLVDRTLPDKVGDSIQNIFEKITQNKEESYTSYDYNVLTINHELNIKHWEFELAFDYKDSVEILECIQKLFEKIEPPAIPINIRTTKADNLWMSPCYQRDTLWVDFLIPRPDDDNDLDLYNEMIKNLIIFNPRIHWGKLDFIDSNIHGYTKSSFPMGKEFWELKKRIDPNNKFVNFHAASISN